MCSSNLTNTLSKTHISEMKYFGVCLGPQMRSEYTIFHHFIFHDNNRYKNMCLAPRLPEQIIECIVAGP